ncbi:MAG TPA: DUF4153 domain-containing protein [Anaerolineales bacterium]|nr:DUF4153 domain-containing protein [Anaerolineales bacterium]
MKANPNRFLLLVLLLGWMFDFLFWEKPLGINFAIYVMLCLAAGIFLLQKDGVRIARRSSLLLLPIAFLSALTFLRAEGMTVFLSIVMTLFLMGVFAVTYQNGQWVRFGVLDYFLGYLHLFGSIIARPLGFSLESRRAQSSLREKRSGYIWAVVRGVVIALPVVAIFASLLSSADPIFADRFQRFLDLFDIENLSEYIFRLVYILIFAYALAGVFLHAAEKSNQSFEKRSLVPRFFGFTETSIVLGSVLILFTAFVIVQFQYFFGGQANITVEGYTYSAYARRGFGELVAVAFFSLLLLLGLGTITQRDTESQKRIFSGMGVGLVGLVIVILVSAFQRLTLYEYAYGFSRLRTYTHVFMIWLGLLLIAVAVLEMLRRERAIALAMVLASLGFVISLGVLNVDAFIVRQNIQREVRGLAEAEAGARVSLDAQYLLSLSDDALPELVRAFSDESLPEDVRLQVGAVLACIRYERNPSAHTLPWQSFHLSHFNAARALQSVDKELDSYDILFFEQERLAKVEMPNGEEFFCN